MATDNESLIREATESLGASLVGAGAIKPNIPLRIGGLLTLERVARDGVDDQRILAMDMICAYIRASSPHSKPEEMEGTKASIPPPVSEDIKVAVDILADRTEKQIAWENEQKSDHRLNLDNTNLAEVDFTRRNQEPDFSHVSFRNCSLVGANFKGGNLSHADLENTDLTGADLRGVNLTKAHLKCAHLGKADLRRANLRKANLLRADLSDADLRGVDFRKASLLEAGLKGAYLSGANLTKAYLARAYFMDADLAIANLTEANLWEANLTRACLKNAKLTGACLRKANLTWANAEDASFTEANLLGAKVTGANFAGFGALGDGIKPNEKLIFEYVDKDEPIPIPFWGYYDPDSGEYFY